MHNLLNMIKDNDKNIEALKINRLSVDINSVKYALMTQQIVDLTRMSIGLHLNEVESLKCLEDECFKELEKFKYRD